MKLKEKENRNEMHAVTELLKIRLTLPNCRASLRTSFTYFFLIKTTDTFTFYKNRFLGKFNCYSLTNYFRCQNIIKFNKSFYKKSFIQISCSYVHLSTNYTLKQEIRKYNLTLIFDISTLLTFYREQSKITKLQKYVV